MAQQRTQKRLNRVRGSRHTPYTRFEIDCIGVRFSFTSLSFMLGSVHISSVRKILSAKARLQGEKRSKVGHLASIFNAAGAFLSQKIATR